MLASSTLVAERTYLAEHRIAFKSLSLKSPRISASCEVKLSTRTLTLPCFLLVMIARALANLVSCEKHTLFSTMTTWP